MGVHPVSRVSLDLGLQFPHAVSSVYYTSGMVSTKPYGAHSYKEVIDIPTSFLLL